MPTLQARSRARGDAAHIPTGASTEERARVAARDEELAKRRHVDAGPARVVV